MSEHSPEDPELNELFKNMDKSTPEIVEEHQVRQEMLIKVATILQSLSTRRGAAELRIVEMQPSNDAAAIDVVRDMFVEGEQRAIKGALLENLDEVRVLFEQLGWGEDGLLAITDSMAFTSYLEDDNVLLHVAPNMIKHVESPDRHLKREFIYYFEIPIKGATKNIFYNQAMYNTAPNADGDRQEKVAIYLEDKQLQALMELMQLIQPSLIEYYRVVRNIEQDDDQELGSLAEQLLRRTTKLSQLRRQADILYDGDYSVATQEADEFNLVYKKNTTVMNNLFRRLGWQIPSNDRLVFDTESPDFSVRGKLPLAFSEHCVATHEYGNGDNTESFVYYLSNDGGLDIEITRGKDAEYRTATIDEVRALITMVDLIEPGYIRRYEVIIEQGNEDGE